MKKEVEVLWRLLGAKTHALRVLRSLEGFEPAGVKRTRDMYYFDPKHPGLKPGPDGRLKECLRLRQKGGKNYLAYKVDHFRGRTWLYSDEHETEIADHGTMEEIVRLLGLEPLVEVVMEKHIFHSSDLEVAVEDVKGLGPFIEVETLLKVGESGIAVEKDRIRSFLAGTGIRIGEELNTGKPELLLRQRKHYVNKY